MNHKLLWDSTEPTNVPSGSLAIAYYGGIFNWPEDEIKRMRAVYRMNEVPGKPSYMRFCRAVGVEPGAHSVSEAVTACHWRFNAGHDDFTVYTSLEPGDNSAYQPGMAGMIQALRSNAPNLPFRIHVADWGTDPNSRPEIEGVKAWAKQYLGNVHGGAYDLSILYGKNDLVSL